MRRACRGSLVVFAKQPRPGRVKTRMSPPLSPEQAALLYTALLEDVLHVSALAARVLELEAVLAVDPPDAAGELARLCPPGFRAVAQRGADLSERMEWAVREAAAGGASRILLRGSDSPTLDTEIVAQALEALDTHELSVCPDRDGGYSLIGLRGPVPGLFDHAMSTSRVLDDTLANAARAGLRSKTLSPRFDLDTVEDLAWLAAAVDSGQAHSCPRTLEYADAQDLWKLVRAPDALELADDPQTR